MRGPTVTDIVKGVWFVDASAPNTNHVLIPIHEELEPGPVAVLGHPRSPQRLEVS